MAFAIRRMLWDVGEETFGHRCGRESGNSVSRSGLPTTLIAVDGKRDVVDRGLHQRAMQGSEGNAPESWNVTEFASQTMHMEGFRDPLNQAGCVDATASGAKHQNDLVRSNGRASLIWV